MAYLTGVLASPCWRHWHGCQCAWSECVRSAAQFKVCCTLQAIQDEAVAATRTRVGVVAKSVTAGILEAAKLDEDRKRKQADGAEAAKKRAKVFMLCVDDGSDEDSSSEDDSPPSAAAVPGKNL